MLIACSRAISTTGYSNATQQVVELLQAATPLKALAATALALLDKRTARADRGTGLAEQAGLQVFSSYANPALSLGRIARDLGVSQSALSRVIKGHYGIGFRELLLKMRLSTAQALLEAPSLSIKEIAVASGFSRTSVLDENFRASFGVSPREYRALKLRGSNCKKTEVSVVDNMFRSVEYGTEDDVRHAKARGRSNP
jgi:AraC-like DNA-binding protein